MDLEAYHEDENKLQSAENVNPESMLLRSMNQLPTLLQID
jgi:hypothetical protein